MAECCGKLDYPSPEGRVAAEQSEAVGWGEEAKAREVDSFQNSPPGLASLGHPPHPNSGLPEFGASKWPKSDISDLGWGGISSCVQALHPPGAGKVTFREALPHDTGVIQNYVRALAPDSRRNRFLGAVNELSASDVHAMTHGDHGRYRALIAESVVNGTRTMIGEARYALTPDGRGCEFAISVAER